MMDTEIQSHGGRIHNISTFAWLQHLNTQNNKKQRKEESQQYANNIRYTQKYTVKTRNTQKDANNTWNGT